MPDQRRRLPKSVAAHVDAHRDALAAIAHGEDRTSDAVHAADTALRAAWALAETNPRTAWSTEFLDDLPGIIADRLAETRRESGWSQAQLAEAMEPYANWTRFTVAEIENRRRAVSLEELLVLAGLFGEPVVTFLIPTNHVRLELQSMQLNPDALTELLLGQSGRLGAGGASWPVAARVAGEPSRRPAPDLWANRQRTHRRTRGRQSEATPSTKPKKDGT